jgi:acetoin utilization deacetylase AcuC-like enzyme
MITLFTDRRMIDHDPPGGHPECPERLRAVLDHLDRTGLGRLCRAGNIREVTREELLRVHEPQYVDAVSALKPDTEGWIEGDTWYGKGTRLAARLAAGAAVEGVATVLGNSGRRAFCAIRPPGHHARPGAPMGFCLFDNVAVAAAASIHQWELNRVMIVDFDVHHGNGTQEIFYEDGRIAFLSIHRYPFYPGTGAKDETGRGPGRGFTWNAPIAFGTARRAYHAAFREGLETLADRVKPELMLISAGFDAHAADPIGSLGLEVEDFETLTRAIVDVAETHAAGRIVSVLEGGYNIRVLVASVEAHLRALGAQEKTS